MDARETLINELRTHALVVGEVTLTSGALAQYYVDAKRAILLPAGFAALAALVAAQARARGATAVGGMTMGADPVACAALAIALRGQPGVFVVTEPGLHFKARPDSLETTDSVARQAATESRSPRAFRTLTTGANSGFPSGDSAL